MGIRNTDTGIDPGFVDIESTAVFTKDFKHRTSFAKSDGSDWSSGKIESTLEEISLRATCMRHSLMPLRMTDSI